ncbi:hypothetical protein PYCC9005_002486 [Savitreella phatthalungensis]
MDKAGLPRSIPCGSRHHPLRWQTLLYRAGALVVVVFLAYDIFSVVFPASFGGQIVSQHTFKAFADDLAQCNTLHERPVSAHSATRINPRFDARKGKPALIKNATLLNGDGTLTWHADIFMENGVFKSVGSSAADAAAAAKGEVLVWDVQGRFVTPGLVDMHSHAGVNSLPEFWGNEDTNEISDPITSQVRVTDALSPSDPMFQRILSGGVTTSLILPGSANVIGGEAFAIKMAAQDTLEVEDYLVQKGVQEKRQRWLKMACGENPKRVYPGKTNTRLGEGWAFRHRFDQARQLVQRQDDWCAMATAGGYDAVRGSRFPVDLELESVAGVLRGDVQVNNHCYETHDLEARLKLAEEFDFKIGAFHHAQDAYLVPAMLRRAPGNLTIATFANLWGYKKEAFEGSPYAGKLLTDAGIRLTYKSDHPVTNSQHLLYQAQLATHFDLDDALAIQAVTLNPADSLGLGHRIGRVANGYDADLVVWSGWPLELGSHPEQVWIDGATQLDMKPSEALFSGETFSSEEREIASLTLPTCNGNTDNFVVHGISVDMSDDSQAQRGRQAPFSLVVKQGQTACFGTREKCLDYAEQLVNELGVGNVQAIDLGNSGHVIPPIVSTAQFVGLGEIPSEEATLDGSVQAHNSLTASDKLARAHFGLIWGGPHQHRLKTMGVSTLIIPPMSAGGSALGVSAAIDLTAGSLLDKNIQAIPKREVAVHMVIGNEAKTEAGTASTVSGQLSALWSIVVHGNSSSETEDPIWIKVRTGQVPLVVSTGSGDEIAHLIQLARHARSLRLVILGGAEAHLHAAALAELKDRVSVLLFPRCMPSTWRTRRCLPGPPLSRFTGFGKLYRAGVNVALVSDDDGNTGEMYFESAWQRTLYNEAIDRAEAEADAAVKPPPFLSERDAVALVSTKVSSILGLPARNASIANGQSPTVNLFARSPLHLKSRLAARIVNGRLVECSPRIKTSIELRQEEDEAALWS